MLRFTLDHSSCTASWSALVVVRPNGENRTRFKTSKLC